MSAFAFEEWPKIPRMRRELVVTEKLDGTNAQVALFEITSEETLDAVKADPLCLAIMPNVTGNAPLAAYAGSRTRWIIPGADNFGFATWVYEHLEELQTLGPGRHFGEWYGRGIQRNYGLNERRFALFNVKRWNPDNPNRPACCDVVPVLARGETLDVNDSLARLATQGSVAVPGFMNPEGIVIFHTASSQLYKMTLDNDGGKWRVPA